MKMTLFREKKSLISTLILKIPRTFERHFPFIREENWTIETKLKYLADYKEAKMSEEK